MSARGCQEYAYVIGELAVETLILGVRSIAIIILSTVELPEYHQYCTF